MYKLGGGIVIGKWRWKWEKEKGREEGRRGCRWNTKWEMERGEGGMWEIKRGKQTREIEMVSGMGNWGRGEGGCAWHLVLVYAGSEAGAK